MSKKHIICLVVVIVLFAAAGIFAFFSANSCTFEYERNLEGGITIHSYTGNRRSVVIPDTLDGLPVTEIDSGAFMHSEITDIVIPDTVKIIGDRAFCRCEQLVSVNIPNSLERIGPMAFLYTPFETTLGDDEFVIINNSILYKYNGTSDSVTIPEGITCIGGYGFYENGLTEIAIPNSVKYIETQAFASCKNLISVSVPAAEYIGNNAFSHCEKLQTADITSQIVGSSAFYNCTSLADITLNETQKIGNSAFHSCTALQSAALPDTLTIIGNDVFQGSGLTEIDIPAGISEIYSETFKDCTALSRVGLKNGVTAIHNSAFSGCMALSEIVLPDSLTFIGERAFFGSGLKKVIIPDSVTELGVLAFSHCPQLAEVRLSEGVTAITHSCFDSCNALAELIIPDGVTEIGMCAFQNTPSLKTVNLPDGLKTLDFSCFYNSGIDSVFIPDSVEVFDKQAFLRDDCTTLLYTENCKAYQQMYDAEHWRVHNDYVLVEVASRKEAEENINAQMN